MATVRYQWQGGDAGASLTNAANWSPSGVPGPSDIIVFGAGASPSGHPPTLSDAATGSTTVGQLIVHSDQVTLSGGTLTLNALTNSNYGTAVGIGIDTGGSLTLGAAGAPETVTAGPVYVGTLSRGELTIEAGSTLIDTAATIGNPTHIGSLPTSPASVEVDGAGSTWITSSLSIAGLQPPATYSTYDDYLEVHDGGTVFVDGQLNVGPTVGLGIQGGTLEFGSLSLNGVLAVDTASHIAGDMDLSHGEILGTGTGALTLPDRISLEALPRSAVDRNTIDAGDMQLTLTGPIGNTAAPASIDIEGFVRFSGAGNTYSGGTYLESGANFRVAAEGAAGTGAIVFDAADTILAVSPGVTLSNAIEGFQQGDQIVLAGLAATSAKWAGDVLTVFNGSAKLATLDLVGAYQASNFALAGNGKGDTVITIAPVAASALKFSSAMAGFSAGTGALATSAASGALQQQTPLLAAAPTSHH
jgi:hypothetical protein